MILNFDNINDILQNAFATISEEHIENVLKKIDNFIPLSDIDVSYLLYADHRYNEIIFNKARNINILLHDKIIKFYGISYISDFCVGTCRYCGDNIYTNREEWVSIIRKADKTGKLHLPKHFLSPAELQEDVNALLIKHPKLEQLCILSGDTPSLNIERWVESLKAISEIYKEKIILNIPPMNINEFRKIRMKLPNRKLQFRVFQETYEETIYRKEHPYYDYEDQRTQKLMSALIKEKKLNSVKSNFWYRINSQERAILAGFDEYGLGVLLGLNNGPHASLFEVIALKRHSEYLFSKFGLYPKTISFPRILPSKGIEYKPSRFVDDDTLERIVAVIKLTIPQAELIITCREKAEFRRRIRPIINIEDFEARPGPGGNISNNIVYQMEIVDRRKGKEVKDEIEKDGYKTI